VSSQSTTAQPAAGGGDSATAGVGFEAFVEARSGRLLGTAVLLTQDRALAEDLLQTALAKAWFAWSRIEGDPEPYVRRIVVNTYMSWWRRRWNGEVPSQAVPEHADADRHAGADARHDLATALARLPKRQRAVVVLRFYEDMTERQVARLLGCSVGTVKSQTSKALAKLRVDAALADPMDMSDGGVA
jgi:RNA polymerase sigma-70 factor (sigma-E family)